MVDDYRTEHCETCPEWRKRWVITDSPSDKCAYVFPGDHCEYARQKLEENGKNIPLTPEEFAAEMLRLQKNIGDEEARHGDMDELMCHVLISLGYEKGVEIFNNTPKWYA